MKISFRFSNARSNSATQIDEKQHPQKVEQIKRVTTAVLGNIHLSNWYLIASAG